MCYVESINPSLGQCSMNAPADFQRKDNMKKVLVALCFVGALACNKSGPDATTYHNVLMNIVNGNETLIAEMNSAMHAQNYEQAEAVRKKWLASVESQKAQVEKVGPYKGDASFQKSVIDALTTVRTVLTVDYPELIAIRSSKTADRPAESKALDAINAALEGLANKLNAASSDFERKYNK
jgi:hypothetical protein